MNNNIRYEINHNCEIVAHDSSTCSNMDDMLISLFSQFNWQCKITEKQKSCRTLLLTDANNNSRTLNVFRGTIRDESRNAYEKKMQLGADANPKEKSKDSTIIIGIYVFEANDSLKDALFVGYPIDDSIRYETNPSLRGTFVNNLLINAKTKGFIYDKEHNLVGFRPEFIYYYLDHYMELHYSSKNASEKGDLNMGDNEKPTYSFDSKVKTSIVNRIVYGTPGSGKSFYVKNSLLKEFDEDNIIRTTFFQDYTNTDFVGQILPIITGEQVSYKFNPGPFTLALEKAIKNPQKEVALVIEELNRGNAPSIFGDIFQLLDRKDGKSEYKITNVNIQKYLSEQISEQQFDYIMLPANLCIIGTMNTSDQNVFTLDTAFKRRWEFEKIRNTFDDKHPYKYYHIPGIPEVTWEEFVTRINNYMINNNLDFQSEDKQLGVFFVSQEMLADTEDNAKDEKKIKKFAYKVLEYLWDDVAKFDRNAWFNNDINSLDVLVDKYISSGKEVFKNDIFEKSN